MTSTLLRRLGPCLAAAATFPAIVAGSAQAAPCDQDETGACCLGPSDCVMVSAFECNALGGFYFGDDSSCFFDPCDEPVPAVPALPWGKLLLLAGVLGGTAVYTLSGGLVAHRPPSDRAKG